MYNYIKGKDIILSDFLLRQKHNNSNPHEIIPISFNMQYILHDRNYNTGNIGRYMVQTWSQAKSSGKKLAEVQGVGKSVDPHSQPGKQTIQCIVSKVKDVSQHKTKIRTRESGNKMQNKDSD